MATTEGTPASHAILTGRARAIALWVVLLAFFVDVLDTTIVNVAIPSIQANLQASFSTIQWIVAGFALFLITGGRLGDIYGYRRLFILGMAGFTVASLLSGLASTTAMLIASRLLQGFMAAMMVPQILAIIQVMFPTTAERQGVSAVYGAVAGVATVFGPIAGALLISGNLWGSGWRAIFLINLPVGIGAIILGRIFLPKGKSPHPLKLDLLGVALILLAMLMLMFPLIQGRELDWPTWTLISIAASSVVFVLFGWSQVAKERRDGSPLVGPHLFRTRSFVAGVFVYGVFFAIVTGFFLTLTLFLQIGLGYSALKAGLTGIPFSLGISVAAGSSGPLLVPRFGRTIITAGTIVMAIGFAIFIWTINFFGGAVTPWELIPAQLISGVGMGFVVAPVYPFILAEVPLKDAGSASGVINAIGQIGGAIGVAVIGVIFFGAINSQSLISLDSAPSRACRRSCRGRRPRLRTGGDCRFVRDLLPRPVHRQGLHGRSRELQGERKGPCRPCGDPAAMAKAVGDLIAKHATDANQINFTAALTRALMWLMGAMFVVGLASFLLPRRPRSETELSAAGIAA